VDAHAVRPQLDDLRLDQRTKHRDRGASQRALVASRFVTVADQPLHGGTAAAVGSREHVQEHPVADFETGNQRLGLALAQPSERARLPVLEPALRRLLEVQLLVLLGVGCSLRLDAQVLDHVLWSLHDDAALGVEATPPGTSSDLLEITNGQDRGVLTVVLAQLREQYRAKRDVDADAQRVRAADQLQVTALSQPLDQAAILREHPGVVYSDSVRHEAA